LPVTRTASAPSSFRSVSGSTTGAIRSWTARRFPTTSRGTRGERSTRARRSRLRSWLRATQKVEWYAGRHVGRL